MNDLSSFNNIEYYYCFLSDDASNRNIFDRYKKLNPWNQLYGWINWWMQNISRYFWFSDPTMLRLTQWKLRSLLQILARRLSFVVRHSSIEFSCDKYYAHYNNLILLRIESIAFRSSILRKHLNRISNICYIKYK